MISRIRIFVSSPGDVREERLRAQLVITKLARDYGNRIALIPYFWESEPLRASGHFQDEIEPPSTHDIVILILWSRLGTLLPERTAVRVYSGIDGRTPVTGTEWEFEDALAAFRERNAPDLLVYRRTGDPGASLTDVVLRAEQERQWNALQVFWSRHFEDRGVFRAASAQYATLDDFDSRIETDLGKLIERHIRARVDGETAQPFHLTSAPYRGLSAYDFADAPVFFGRDSATRAGLVRLSAASAGGCAFLMVLGASGSGKSSLARAGLLPALIAAKAVPRVGLWRRVVMRPGDAGSDPVLALAQALLGGDPRRGEGLPELGAPGTEPTELAAHLRASAADASYTFRTSLRVVAEQARSTMAMLAHEEARLVLLVDQLEELFTRPDIALGDRALFVRILDGLARSNVVWVIVTMRSDLWHRVAEMPDLLTLMEAGARFDLQPPDGAEILEVIRRPARAVGLEFEEDETRRGLDAVLAEAAASERGALPLLSVVLEDLYRRDVIENGGGCLTVASYRGLGGLKGAIAARAERAWLALDVRDPEAAAALPVVLRALVTAGAGVVLTSRTSPLDAFPTGSPSRRLIETLVAPDFRLLIIEGNTEEAYLRVSHEALIEHWPRASSWAASNRRDIETEALLTSIMRSFLKTPFVSKTPLQRETFSGFLSGLYLEQGTDLSNRGVLDGSSAVGQFISLSLLERQTARRRRITKYALGALAISFCINFSIQYLGDWFVYYRSWRRESARTDISGTLIGFATRRGELSFEGSGGHGVFTKSLVNNLDNNYNDFFAVMEKTNTDLINSKWQQVPEFQSSLNAQIFLHNPPARRRNYVLTIGVANYDNAPKLNNAAGDAEYFSAAMEKIGYRVDLSINETGEQINTRIKYFLEKIRFDSIQQNLDNESGSVKRISLSKDTSNSLAIVYFSGHTFEFRGEIFIAPRDVNLNKSVGPNLADNGFINLSELVKRLESEVSVRIIFVDGSRDNPFSSK